MNPSTEDFLEAIDQVNAEHIFLFPNNKNIILAAEQAMHLTKDKKVIVIPSKTVPQGITAIINYVAGEDMEENSGNMIAEMKKVRTGQVTYAVRDTVIDGQEIKEGNIMGIGDGKILSVGEEIKSTTIKLVNGLVFDDAELISLYYGSDVDEATAGELAKALEEAHPDCEVELNMGGQPIYYYVVSVE